MYYSNYYNSNDSSRKSGLPYRTPYASSIVCSSTDKAAPSYAGSWSVDDVISNRSAFSPPHKLLLSVSDQCMFACNMCTFHPGKLEAKMTLEDWKRLVYETRPSDVVYTLFGGEPLLYQEIDELVSYMGTLKAQMDIVTNGWYLEEHLDVLLENQCRIVISIDGIEDIHDSVRGQKGSFARIEKSLSRIFSRYPAEKQKLVSVNSVILPENAEHVRKLIDYLYGIGISNVSFQHLQFFGEKEQQETDRIWQDFYQQNFTTLLSPRKNYVFSKDTIENIQKAVVDIREARLCYPDMGIYIYPELSSEESVLYYSREHEKLIHKSLCLSPWTSAAIAADGNISLCLDACIGNYKEQNFWSAWYGRKAMDFRNVVVNHIFPVCTRCCNFYNSYIPG